VERRSATQFVWIVPPPKSRRPDDSLARRQAALLRLSAELAAALDEDEICRRVVHGLRDESLGYHFVGLFLVDCARPSGGKTPRRGGASPRVKD
jgi:hypothetical protein